jgi:hypothetical protein
MSILVNWSKSIERHSIISYVHILQIIQYLTAKWEQIMVHNQATVPDSSHTPPELHKGHNFNFQILKTTKMHMHKNSQIWKTWIILM